MAVKEPKRARSFSETSGDDYFCDEYFSGDWIELFFLKEVRSQKFDAGN